MSEISGIGGPGGAASVRGITPKNPGELPDAQTDAHKIHRGSDKVDLSGLSTYLQSQRNTSAFREDFVSQVRKELDAGVYPQQRSLDIALDQMIYEAG